MGKVHSFASLAAILLSSSVMRAAAAEDLSIDSNDKIVDSARLLADDLMSLYDGNEPGNIPGLLPSKDYYFWESGLLWGSMIDYWHLTGNSTYNDMVMSGLLYQVGQGDNFMPVNQSAKMGNDDQCFWALSAMMAAEDKFPNPPADQPQWLTLAEAVFNDMNARIDDKTCNGGLRWMTMTFNNGYNYKNTISSACLFDLSARLARYTGNATYANTAVEVWDWLSGVGFLDEDTWSAYDGANTQNNCTDISKVEFSYSTAALAHGAAFMYNYTDGSDTWRTRVEGLVGSILDKFFPDDIAYEAACEEKSTCTTDMITFKGITTRWLAGLTQLAPFSVTKILPVLQKSAKAAVGQCTGGKSGRQCGFYWKEGKFVKPDTSGVGEEMNVLAAVSNLLIADADAPATHSTAGSSSGSQNGSSTGASGTSTGAASQTSEPSGGAGRLDGFSALLVGSMLAILGWASLM